LVARLVSVDAATDTVKKLVVEGETGVRLMNEAKGIVTSVDVLSITLKE
jgi:hypothetical protein